MLRPLLKLVEDYRNDLFVSVVVLKKCDNGLFRICGNFTNNELNNIMSKLYFTSFLKSCRNFLESNG